MVKEDKQYLRQKKEELYARILELQQDSEKMKRLALTYPLTPSYKLRLRNFAYILDNEVDRLDECCIDIETYLKLGKLPRVPEGRRWD